MATLRIGSRGSQLALWQANHVAGLLRERGRQVEIEVIKTTGDKIADVALAKVDLGAARAAEARLRGLQHTWLREASGEEFNAKLNELRALTEEYRKLPERRKQKVRELERALYETQLRHYLEQFDIASADIPDIKEGRKAMLSASGLTMLRTSCDQHSKLFPASGIS